MKYLIHSAACLVIAGSGAVGHAGGERDVGNGGGVWVCRNADHSIRWAELVDLYEAREEFRLHIEKSKDSVDDQIQRISEIIKTTDSDYFDEFSQNLDFVKKNSRRIKNANLALIDDSHYRIEPSSETCVDGKVAYEQVANYTNYNALLINESLYEALPETDQAALWGHEAIYRLLRERDEAKDSVKARMTVGYLFSNTSPEIYKKLIRFEVSDAGADPENFITISLQFDSAQPFSEGLAAVQIGGKWGYISPNGSFVLAPQFDFYGKFKEGLAWVGYWDTLTQNKNGVWTMSARFGLINKNGEFIVKPMVSRIYYNPIEAGETLPRPNSEEYGFHPFSSGLSIGYLTSEGHNVIIDSSGRTAMEGEGYFANQNGNRFEFCPDVTPYKCGIVKSDMTWVVRPGDYESSWLLAPGVIGFTDEETHLSGLLNNEGQIVLPAHFQISRSGSDGRIVFWDKLQRTGYMDYSGNVVIPATFSSGGSFFEGLAEVYERINNVKYATFISPSGKKLFRVPPAVFVTGGGFSQGMIAVETSYENVGFMDRRGRIRVWPYFQQVQSFTEGLAAVRKGNKWGYISLLKVLSEGN